MADRPFNRRDFLKLAAVGFAAATAPGVVKAVEKGADPHFINGLKVTKELIEAEISRDPERILESRKLAMVWLFAETSIKYSKEMGLEGAGSNMDHYLYGHGESLDISFLYERMDKEYKKIFVEKLISKAVSDMEEGRHITPEKDYEFTKRALRELKSETGLKVALDAREVLDNWELFNASGGARYTLHALEASIVSQDIYGEHVVLEKGIDIEVIDRYYWQLDHPMNLDSKAAEATGTMAGKLFDQFYKSRDVVEKTIKDLGLSNEQVAKIMSIYSDDSRDRVTEGLAPRAYDLVDKVNRSLIGKPDLVENDLNLLKKLGAMDYDMKGHINIPNRLEIYV